MINFSYSLAVFIFLMHQILYISLKFAFYIRLFYSNLSAKSLSEAEAQHANEIIETTNEQINEIDDYPFF